MLELTDGGRCMSGPDAVEFFERLADMIDEDIRTDDFCDEYTWALNRLRYHVRQSLPVPVKVSRVKGTTYSCGKCGHGLRPNGNGFCPKCGCAIDWSPLQK